MGLKKILESFFITLMVAVVLWVLLGLFLIFICPNFQEVSHKELFLKAPNYMYELIKMWLGAI